MKTLQECKDEVARTEGHADWNQMEYRYRREKCDQLVDKAAELYASQYREEIQRKDEENAELRKQLHDHNGMCQKKMSEQLEAFLPDLRKKVEEIERLTDLSDGYRDNQFHLNATIMQHLTKISKLETELVKAKEQVKFWVDSFNRHDRALQLFKQRDIEGFNMAMNNYHMVAPIETPSNEVEEISTIDYETRLLHLSIMDRMNKYVNDKDRETIHRRHFYEISLQLAEEISGKSSPIEEITTSTLASHHCRQLTLCGNPRQDGLCSNCGGYLK